MIIFNQRAQYENLIKNGFEKYPNFRDLMIIAKELKFVKKMEQMAIKKEIIAFCKSKIPDFDANNYKSLINKVMNKIKITENYTEIPEKLTFFKEEISSIADIPNEEYQKLIFIFCCLSKLKKSDGIYLNSGNSIKLSDIFDLSKIKKTKKEQEKYLFKLKKEGLLTVDLRPLLKFHPTLLKMSGEVALEIVPSSEIISELCKFTGKPKTICQCCGKEIYKMSNRTKYCPECARRIHIEKTNSKKKQKA